MPSPLSFDLSGDSPAAQGMRARSWQRLFNAATLHRSRAYVSGRSVTVLDFGFLPDRTGLFVEATVQGSAAHPYRVHFVYHSGRAKFPLESACSCPVAYRCKHIAAVLEWMSQALTNGSPPGMRAEVPSKPALSPATTTWLAQIERAARAGARSAKAPTNQFLAYCLEPEWPGVFDEKWHLILRPALRLRDGTVRIKDSEAQADPTRPTAYMTKEDVSLTAIHGRLTRSAPFREAVLRGPGWPEIVLGALELERLYCNAAEEGPEPGEYQLMTALPPTPVEMIWETLDDGSVRPVVRLPDALVLLPVNPPLVLEPLRHRIGPIADDCSASLLAAWAAGPTVAPEQHELVAKRLAALPAARPLPVPKSLPVTELSGLTPVPHLSIHREVLGNYSQYETIIGELSFRYGDSPKLYSLNHQSDGRESWIEGERRFVLERRGAAEMALEKSLHAHGVVPLHRVFRPHVLSPRTLHAVTVEDPYPSMVASWLRFLDDEVPALRAQGWVVEVDPDSGLTVHDCSDVISVLEADPEHGIDWFRFDLRAEAGGKSIDLIPLIADAILDGLPDPDADDFPDELLVPCENRQDGYLRFPAKRFLEICRQVAHLFQGSDRAFANGRLPVDRLTAAGLADSFEIDDSDTNRALADLSRRLRDIDSLPAIGPPATLEAELRPYQLDGYRWLRFLAEHRLNGILADDMGLGKTVQTLAYLAATSDGNSAKPSLVVAPTSVVGNWAAEAARFTPGLEVLVLHGSRRADLFDRIPHADLVVTSYALLNRDQKIHAQQEWNTVVLDEAQYIKNPKTAAAQRACALKAEHRFCLSGTPIENHLGELWSLLRFLMPGFLGDQKAFGRDFRGPIERHQDVAAQQALNRRVAPLILRRTKDQVASELPPKTEIVHTIPLGKKEADLYESVRAAMDERVRDALAARGLAKSHIIVLDALLKLRQICCHPSLLKLPDARTIKEGSKLHFLTSRLLPELIEEGRRILLFSQFTSMLALIEHEIEKAGYAYLKLTGSTTNRPALVKRFQSGDIPLFLISLKAGGTGLNLTAADTVIHYDPWWNPAVESQATDRAHRIGQDKPVFVHKLLCEGTIEERILELQEKKSALVSALLSEETSKLKIDQETLSHLLAPIA